MCGLLAFLSLAGGHHAEAVAARMLPTISHRGPDDSGIWSEGPVALGFRRLSILDLSAAGHQPMSSSDGQCTIVFNGEIYNFVELRSELEALGHRFRSHGDSEVLLGAYRQWGTDCLQRLRGMWSFVLFDRARGVLFGSRDRFGMKPLFRHQTLGHAIFASEIKAIRASGLYKDALNLRTCANYLYSDELDFDSSTFYEGIVQLPAAHAFELTLDGRYRQWRYWDIQTQAYQSPGQPAEAFAALFDDAMRLHMRSDVPVGVNLSGGLDSTSILCAAARLNAEAGATTPLLAFSYQDPRFDETRYVRDTLAQTGAQIVPLGLTPAQLWDSLPTVLAAHDEPVHTMTALVGYHLMALAARHGVKVVLNGQGADEVIGGYGSYFEDRWAELVRTGRRREAQQQIDEFTHVHGGDALARYARARRHVVQSALASLPPYRMLADRRHFARLGRLDWIRPELAEHLPSARQRTAQGLSAVLHKSVQREPLPLYLRIEDRNSMAHSVEARLPFLDHRLVELVFAMPSEWKLRGPWNKFVLREAMKGSIPESVRTRVDKMGFPVDVENWLRGPLYEPVKAILYDREFVEHPFFDARRLQACLEAHVAGTGNHATKLFSAVQFFLWQRGSRLLTSQYPAAASPVAPAVSAHAT